MKAQSYSKRIAISFMAATAALIILIFASIYLVVFKTVYSHINQELFEEYADVLSGVEVQNGEIVFTNPGEWNENEHDQVEVNPTFIQVADASGKIIKRSPNLMDQSLGILKDKKGEVYFNTKLSSELVRQLQMVLINDRKEKIGYISIALPFEGSKMVLENLLIILLTAFPFVLLVLYLITRFMAQRSISPVKMLTEAAEKITRENLNERISLPAKQDELFTLTKTINDLLDRIEETILREKQFSSDASHELRTPLSVLKGTLELMSRKPRDLDYYKEKTNTCLEEVNRMSVMVDQLLLLARYEKTVERSKFTKVNLTEMVNKIIARHADHIEQKGVSLFLNIPDGLSVTTDGFMVEQIIENLFTNALKYSYPNSTIGILSENKNKHVSMAIKDEGIGMSGEEQGRIFNRFFRADESRNAKVRGYGLGLAIAKRFADLLHIEIKVESQPKKGSAFTLAFPDRTMT